MDKKEILERLARHEISKEEAEQMMNRPESDPKNDAKKQPVHSSVNNRHIIYLASVHSLLYLVLVYVFVFVVPDFRKIFFELDISLPLITIQFLRVSQILVKYGIIIIPVLWIGLLTTDILIYAILSKTSNAWLKRGYIWISCVLFVAVYILLILSLILPRTS